MTIKWLALTGVAGILASGLACTGTRAQGGTSSGEPYKVGTFLIDGRQAVGVVLRDSLVIDLAAANADFERRSGAAPLTAPADMKDLITRYDSGVKTRIGQIVAALAGEDQLGANRPAYVRDVASVRTLAPILYPTKTMNAGGNYYGHVAENTSPEAQRKEAESRKKDRGIPYLFLKPTVGAIIGNGDDVLLPRGRDKIDWECELAAVIGKPAKYVTAAQANDYIFGYTIQIDVSDRGRRADKEPRFGGSDWFIGKGHDTFAPQGPYIVPKEFYPHPMNVYQRLTLNGKTMQDSNSTDMIHNVYELVEWGASIMTLFPGDVISAGSPAGTGMSLAVRSETIYFKPGDRMVCTVEGIGSLTHNIKADPGTPSAAAYQ